MDEVLSGPSESDDMDGALVEERQLLASAKKLALFAAGAATQKYMQKIEDEQEIMGLISDMVMEVYAMESTLFRTIKRVEAQSDAAAAIPIAITRVYLAQGMEKIQAAARRIIAAAAEGDMLRTQLAILRRLGKHDPYDTIELRRHIAEFAIERGKYAVV
jgi:butyryl-CoA dehydrogenase